MTIGDDDDHIHNLQQKFKNDPFSLDFQWSLFVSAVQSYRYDTVLRPFPPMFLKDNGEKDMKSLEQSVSVMPNLSCLEVGTSKLSVQQVELLKWVLESKAFSLKSLDKNQMALIREKTGHIVNVPEPNFLFEVTPSEVADAKFQSVRNNRKLYYAYHGSRIENFFSILHNGLASHMNKTSFFGEGTYLSSELSVCMNYSPTGLAWDHSELGNRLGCVAVCEIIDDPGVKCQMKEDDKKTDRSRARAGNSEGGDVPEKYYVVQNNEALRVKYLLVWSERSKKIRECKFHCPTPFRPDNFGPGPCCHQPVFSYQIAEIGGKKYYYRSTSSGIQSWIHENKFVVLMSVYILILTIIGLFNSKSFQYHFRRYFKYR